MPQEYFLSVGLAILAPFVLFGFIKLGLALAGLRHRFKQGDKESDQSHDQ